MPQPVEPGWRRMGEAGFKVAGMEADGGGWAKMYFLVESVEPR